MLHIIEYLVVRKFYNYFLVCFLPIAYRNEWQDGWQQTNLCGTCTAQGRQEGKATGNLSVGAIVCRLVLAYKLCDVTYST
jgi:hypothetical protein